MASRTIWIKGIAAVFPTNQNRVEWRGMPAKSNLSQHRLCHTPLWPSAFPAIGAAGGQIFREYQGPLCHILAVIQGYFSDKVKTKVKGKDVDTNSGILIAYPIKYAIEAIDLKNTK